jgi:CSLREA domain-containing protein
MPRCFLALPLLAFTLSLGCGLFVGEERLQCLDDNECPPGNRCVGNICAPDRVEDNGGETPDAGEAPDAGAAPDAGSPDDSGPLADAGSMPDASADPDAGVVADGGLAPDAGALPDAGTLPDAGALPDAGFAPDGGSLPDAGPQPDSGPPPGSHDLILSLSGHSSLDNVTVLMSVGADNTLHEFFSDGSVVLGSLAQGTDYSLSVYIQPAFPAQTCAFNGPLNDVTGTMGNANEVVALTCTTDTFAPTLMLQGFSTTITVEDGQGNSESITPSTGVPYPWPHEFKDGSVFHFRVTQNSANGNERCWFHHGDDWVKGGAPPQVQLRCGNVIQVTIPDDTVDANPDDAICDDGAGQCSLRAAIMTANRSPVPIVILLNPDQYNLQMPPADTSGMNQAEIQGDLDVLQLGGAAPDILIQGAGAPISIVDAIGLDGVFDVHQGTVVFADLTIRGGNVDGRNGGGVLARSQSHVELHRTTLDVNGSVWTDGMGGGLVTVPSASAALVDVRVEANQANDRGGGLYILGSAKVFRSLFLGNSADDGGGIAVGDGNNAGNLLVVNTTFHQNHVTDSGAALRVRNGHADLLHTSILSNFSDGVYGAIYVDSTATLDLYNTAIGDNEVDVSSAYGGDCRAEESGNITAPGINYLRDDNDCGIDFDADDFTSTSAAPIESLVGLPTGETDHREVLVPGSLSVLTNAAANAICPFVDQRSLPRPVGSGCEIGAAERQP